MDRSTRTAATDLPQDTSQAGAVFRFFIDSWEIDAGGPRPVVGRVLGGYRVAFWPEDPQDIAGWAALDEDIDVDALPAYVVVPPDVRGGRRRGHLHAQWHVTPSEGPLYEAEPLFGLVVRTQIISVDRRQGTEVGREHLWLPVPGTMRLREVKDADWAFDDCVWWAASSRPAVPGEVRWREEAVLVDLRVTQDLIEPFPAGTRVHLIGDRVVTDRLGLQPEHPGTVLNSGEKHAIVHWVDAGGGFEHEGVMMPESLQVIDKRDYQHRARVLRATGWRWLYYNAAADWPS